MYSPIHPRPHLLRTEATPALDLGPSKSSLPLGMLRLLGPNPTDQDAPWTRPGRPLSFPAPGFLSSRSRVLWRELRDGIKSPADGVHEWAFGATYLRWLEATRKPQSGSSQSTLVFNE